MERLTRKGVAYTTSGANVLEIPDIVEGHKYTGQAINKLGQLEDIEEENKIDILQAVDICKKANEQKVIYQKEDYGISSFAILDDLDVEILNHRLYVNARGMYVSLDLLEYGKTWALTKKELL